MLQELNQKQMEAVNHINGPLLIVAGAGSGKTRTLTNRLINLLQNGIAPENILAITFTNKAAQEMRDRISNFNSPAGGPNSNSQNLFVGNFHSLGASILRKEARLLGRTAGFTIFDTEDSRSLIRKCAKNFNIPVKDKEKMTPANLEREFSKMKDELVNFESEYWESASDKELLMKEMFLDYENNLRLNNAFDFDDLIEKPVRLFQKFPEILSKYQDKYKYILVDEYQDTNTSQYNFVKLLASKHRNLGVVGDDQQSIFAFRGSDYRNFLNFEKDWPEVKVVLLEENYRSSSNIIEASSCVIKNNKFQKSKKLWTQNKSGDLVKVVEHKDADYEAEWIVEQLENVKSKMGNGSVGILYRTNAQSRAIEQSLTAADIPYQIFGGLRFYERKEIKDIVAALRYASNPSDSISLERLEKNFNKAPYLELKENLPQKGLEMNPMELIGYFIKTTDYFKCLQKDFTNHFERAENVKELIDFSSNFKNVAEFLERILLLQPMDGEKKVKKVPINSGVINLMTIHTAKGLEFDTVFVVGANEGLLPHQMSYKDENGIEEERRLMYVAMTRARHNLYLNFYSLPSRFLYEIPPDLVEFVGKRNLDLDDEERYIEMD